MIKVKIIGRAVVRGALSKLEARTLLKYLKRGDEFDRVRIHSHGHGRPHWVEFRLWEIWGKDERFEEVDEGAEVEKKEFTELGDEAAEEIK